MRRLVKVVSVGMLTAAIAVGTWSAAMLSALAGAPPLPPPAPPALSPSRTEVPTYPRPGPAPQKDVHESRPGAPPPPAEPEPAPELEHATGAHEPDGGAPEPAQEPTPAPTLDVEAEVMSVDRTKDIFFWHGDVKATYGDLQMQCLRLEGTFDPESRDPTRLLAIGQVVIDGQRWYATSSRLEYDTKTGVAVLTRFDDRKARVHDKQRGIIIEGDEITYNSQDGTFSGTNVRTTIPTREMN